MSHFTNHSNISNSYEEILGECRGLLTGRAITDFANVSALLMQRVPDLNWVGFYLTDPNSKSELWLGPFQGLPACTFIPIGKGVCGTAARERRTIVVDDVDRFPGHIVCDARSRSEIVVPLIKNNILIGVLDVDSARLKRFSEKEKVFFEDVCRLLVSKI